METPTGTGAVNALLLAAGLGSRLLPLTRRLPKCLVPIQDKPLLHHWLERLDHPGVDSILVNLHHHADQVRTAVASHPMARRVILVHEPVLLGTGGTLLANAPALEKAPVLLIHGDNLSDFDLSAFLAAHQARPAHCCLTMMTFDTDAPEQCGIVELDGQGVVRAFHEKVADPPGRLANGAVYILEPEIFDLLAELEGPFIDFSTQVLPRCVGRIFTFHNNVYHRDIGTPESLNRARQEFARAGERHGKSN